MITLRGMTWNHPRGIDPLLAQAREFERVNGVRIVWDARSLEAFEAFPLDELALKYDLMVIDHPHVGMAAASGCLLPLDTVGWDDELRSFEGNTAGGSHETYHYQGHQWALAIDAATQVAARRAGSMEAWPSSFDEVLELADSRRVLCPLAPVHALMCFFTLCANAGHPCATEGDQLIELERGVRSLSRLSELARLVPDECFTMNPIAVFEKMTADARFVYAPLIYGYVSYAREANPAKRIEFGNIAGVESGVVRGSTLGGTGIAVSAFSAQRAWATRVAFELASATCQQTIYACSGGQPAHRMAWTDKRVNAESHGFYANTLATLDGAYIRPRFDGYIAFQARAGEIVQNAIAGKMNHSKAIALINDLFRDAQRK